MNDEKALAMTGTYARPLRALDRVLDLADETITTSLEIHGTEPFFAGHFPEYPIFPGVFQLEAVLQATSQFVRLRLGHSHRVRLSAIKSVRFTAPVRPGDSLTITCRFLLDMGQSGLTADATCANTQGISTAQMKLRFVLEQVL
ncbi:MAG TPA: 3-hydroxyacyl-ACP dehydratase FabZ family protein [Symbiobacteriaceae bacterium]